MANELTIGIVQVGRRDGSWRDSLGMVLSLLDSVRDLSGVDVLFFPENWLSRKPMFLEDYYYVGDILSRYAPIVFVGLSYVWVERKVLSLGIASLNGKQRVVCEKIFPSRAVGERDLIVSGKYHPPIQIDEFWKVGCVACVDIFYPETSRLLVVDGANIIYNPASIPLDRIDLWHSVLKTRASENIVYAIGVNGVGNVYPDGRLTPGQSIIISPGSKKVEVAGSSSTVYITSLDKSEILEQRRRWAFYDDLVNKLSHIYRDLRDTLINE
ncbi:MAG: carbon-nitrogen hydrolase family protein [Desulfurococcales archaeon]|nr:carbon-nitrogen hydrolase family protein [Desulfurococcales archaeon]